MREIPIRVAMAFALLVVVVASVAQAATQVYVDGAGACGGMVPCFTTIQAGVNAAGGGPSTVSIFAGTYDESVDLSLMGSDGSQAQDALIIETQGAVGSVTVAPLGKREAFYNSVDPFPADLTFVGLVITSNTTDGLDLEGVMGSVTVTDVEARDSVYDGLDIRADGDVNLTRVNAHDNGNDGVQIEIPGPDFGLRNVLLGDVTRQAAINETSRAGGTDHSSQRCFGAGNETVFIPGPMSMSVPNISYPRATDAYAPWPPTPGSANLCGFPELTPGTLIINEVGGEFSFGIGSDDTEFIELFDGGVGNTSLDGMVLVLYSNDTYVSYGAFDLDGHSTDADGYFVLCGDAGNVANCDFDVSPDIDLIEDDGGVALYTGDQTDFPNGTPPTTIGMIDAMEGWNRFLAPRLVLFSKGLDSAGSGESAERCPNGLGGLRSDYGYIRTDGSPGERNDCGYSGVIINEIDVDQGTTDDAEFVELFDGGSGNTDLSGLVIVLYDGSDDSSYAAFDLDGQSTDANGFFVLCANDANVPNCDLDVSPDSDLFVDRAGAITLYAADDTDFPNGTPVTDTNLLDAAPYQVNFGSVLVVDSHFTDNGVPADDGESGDDDGLQIDILNGHVSVRGTRTERNGDSGLDLVTLENGRVLSFTLLDSFAIGNGYDGFQMNRLTRDSPQVRRRAGQQYRTGNITIQRVEARDNGHDGIELKGQDGVTGSMVVLEDILATGNRRDGLLLNVSNKYDADAQPVTVRMERCDFSENADGIELRKTESGSAAFGAMSVIDVTASNNGRSGIELNPIGDLVLSNINVSNNGRTDECSADGIDLNASNGFGLLPTSILATNIIAVNNAKDGVQLSAVGSITVDGIYAADNGTVLCDPEEFDPEDPDKPLFPGTTHGDGLQINGDSFIQYPETPASGTVDVNLTNCLLEDNIDDGADIRVNGAVVVTDCEANGNGEDGIDVTDTNAIGIDSSADDTPPSDLIESFGFLAYTAASVSLDGISVAENDDDGVDVGALGPIDMTDICTIDHTRAEVRRGEGVVVKLTGGSLTATDVTSRRNLNGFELLELGGGAFAISKSALTDNTGAGMRSGADNAITATDNWWGAADGPGPGGSGNPVIDGIFGGGAGAISAAPFLTEPVGVEECPERAQDLRDFLAGLGTIEIVLSAPPGDDTPFGFNDDIVMAPATLSGAPTDFVLQDPSNPSQLFMRVPPGNYNVMQMVPPEWQIGTIECTESVEENSTPSGDGATLVLDELETIRCTFGNRLIPLPDGTDCIDQSQCISGNCVDGVCCDTACEGAEVCNLPGSVGTCMANPAPAPAMSNRGYLAAVLALLSIAGLAIFRRLRAYR